MNRAAGLPIRLSAFPFARLALVLGIVAIFAAWPRWVIRSTTELPEQQSWAVSDPDSLYHLRRIQLWMDGGDVTEGVDPWLNHPHGARVPWPPYYTIVARMMIGPGAPDDALERMHWIERRAAHLPLIFGVLTSLLAAMGAWVLLRPTNSPGRLKSRKSDPPSAAAEHSTDHCKPSLPTADVDLRIPGAIAAGLLHAFCNASVYYSSIGNADHHAFVSFLSGAMLVALAWVLKSGVLLCTAKRWGMAAATRWGLLIGTLAGIMLGAWVGSLMYVIGFQLALAALLFLHARKPMPGLPAFGLSFHIAAAAVLLPAVFTSPWLEENPWMVVNLSGFHPLFLLIGAAVFIPLFRLPANPSNAIFRRYPWWVGAALAGLALLLSLFPNSIADGIREGYSWLSTTEEFMTNVAESRPLVGAGAESGVLVQYLGNGIYLLPVAWLLAAFSMWRTARRNAHTFAFSLLPWIIAVPLLTFPALSQRRFGDALSMPMAVVLAFGIIICLRPVLSVIQRKLAGALPGKLNLLAPIPNLVIVITTIIALQWSAIEGTYKVTTGRRPGAKLQAKFAAPHGIYNWLREHQNTSAPGGVLSNWGQGHAITWTAQSPSVACNFGSYVGVDSFQAPSRFFLADGTADAPPEPNPSNPALPTTAAEQLLIDRQVEYVIVPWQLPGMLQHQVAAINEKPWEYYVTSDRRGLTSAWYQTVGAQLMFDGRPAGSMTANSLPYLRMVHQSSIRMQKSNLGGINRRIPAGWIWQRVAGADLQVRGKIGERLQVSLQVQYPGRNQPLIWEASAIVNADGIARLRVPYCTDQNNGDGTPATFAQWTFSGQSGTITIPESAVQSGSAVKIILENL